MAKLGTLRKTQFIYSVKFVCGIQDNPKEPVVRPGIYSTDINIFNFNNVKVSIVKKIVPLVVKGEVVGREPKYVEKVKFENIVLPPESATMDDCVKIARFFNASLPMPISIGFLEIISNKELDITAVYTVSDIKYGHVSMHVNLIPGRKVTY
ncbi:MAG: hypothetical protein WCT77_14920 [Bacteroidota bacterium]